MMAGQEFTDPVIYPPDYHLTFARAFWEKSEQGDGEEAERMKALAIRELALAFESLAFQFRMKDAIKNIVGSS